MPGIGIKHRERHINIIEVDTIKIYDIMNFILKDDKYLSETEEQFSRFHNIMCDLSKVRLIYWSGLKIIGRYIKTCHR